jgi:hypothetical protein
MTLSERTGGLLVIAVLLSGFCIAKPVTHAHTRHNVDWTSAAIAGLGGGSGTITLNTVNGPVKEAFLYWHGINNASATGVYDVPTITFAGQSITGTSLGDATTNCWGPGSSRAFEADVTALVSGNGSYALSGLTPHPGDSANGASLVVIFDDGNPANNHDLVFFLGNDSNFAEAFPGEDDGWHAILSPIDYHGGAVRAEMHVADGQDFQDNSITFATANGTLTIPDSATLWDGISTPTAGTSRAPNGELWDVHDFDITPAFGGVPGSVTLNFDGQAPVSDCLGLVAMLLELEPNTAPPAPGETVAFAKFKAEVEVKSAKKEWEVEGTFTLGPTSDGINPPNEAVSLGVGSFEITFPQGTFKLTPTGAFAFEKTINGMKIEATISPTATPDVFSFEFEFKNAADPTGGTNTTPVALAIGNDSGSTTAKVERKLK